MKIVILGSAAGGGVPQWNCNGDISRAAREGAGTVIPRTQSSIAVSADGANWCLVNCSPDIRQQIIDTPGLHPREPGTYGLRDTPIHSIVLTNGDVDHIAGLLVLREQQAFRLIATPAILQVLEENPIFNVLDPAFVTREGLLLDTDIETAPGVHIEAFSVPGKVALYLEEKARDADGELAIGAEGEETIGLRISTSEAHFFYIPGCAAMTDALADRLRGAPLLLFDGTLWENEEMITQGLGAKTGQRMGHMSMAGPDGSMAALAGLDIARKIFVHINNTNPALGEDSAERAEVSRAGWEIAHDGLEITLP